MRAVTGCFGDRQLVLLRATIGDRGVRVVLGPTLAQLQLPGLEGDLDRHWFELLLDATAGLRASSACTLHWNLQRGVWLGDKRDVFTAATSWAYALLFGDRRTAAAPQMKDAASAIMRQVYASLSEVARAAADCCDQSARRLTMRFLPSVRLAVYCRIMRDTTGRIAQLAEVCPGAIIFCLGLLEGAEPPEIAAAERLFADVIAGRRLDHALDTVLDSWATRRAARAPCHPQSIRMQTERERMMGRAWKRLADASPVERLRILNAQRLLIRRAGALVPASLLVLPPPVGFAPEDIPRTPRANAAWFQLMKRLPLLEVGADSVAARNLSMLVSRQGLDLARNCKAERRTLAAELHNYVKLTKRQPNPRTQPGSLLEEVARWRKGTSQMAAAWTAAGVAPGALSALEDFPLPPPPVDDSDHATIRVRAIRSCKGLLLEGEQMRHCVAQRMQAALKGRVAIYSVEVERQRLTVELTRIGEQWSLGEVGGFAGRAPSLLELRHIWGWIQQALVSPRPRREPTLCPKGCGTLVPFRECLTCRVCGLTTGCR